MSTQAEQLASQFDAVQADVIAAVAGCSEEQWRRRTTSEGWPVGVVAHHIAAVNGDFAGLVGALAVGKTFSPSMSMDDVHRSNAEHARAYANVGKPETLALLRANGETVAQLLRRLDDADLERVAGVFGGRELRVAQVVEWIVIGHANEHLASIRATIAD